MQCARGCQLILAARLLPLLLLLLLPLLLPLLRPLLLPMQRQNCHLSSDVIGVLTGILLVQEKTRCEECHVSTL